MHGGGASVGGGGVLRVEEIVVVDVEVGVFGWMHTGGDGAVDGRYMVLDGGGRLVVVVVFWG